MNIRFSLGGEVIFFAFLLSQIAFPDLRGRKSCWEKRNFNTDHWNSFPRIAGERSTVTTIRQSWLRRRLDLCDNIGIKITRGSSQSKESISSQQCTSHGDRLWWKGDSGQAVRQQDFESAGEEHQTMVRFRGRFEDDIQPITPKTCLLRQSSLQNPRRINSRAVAVGWLRQ